MNILPQDEYRRQLLERVPGLNDPLVQSANNNLQAVGLQTWAVVVIVLLACLLLALIIASFIQKVKFRCCSQTMNKFFVVLIIATLSIGISFAVYLGPKINAAIDLRQATCTVINATQATYTGAPGGNIYRLEIKVTYFDMSGKNVNAVAYDDPIGSFTAGDKSSLLSNYAVNSTFACYYSSTNPSFACITTVSPLDKVLIGVTLPVPFLLLILEFYLCIRQCRKGNTNANQNDEDNIFQAKELGEKDNNDGLGKPERGDNTDTLKKLRTL